MQHSEYNYRKETSENINKKHFNLIMTEILQYCKMVLGDKETKNTNNDYDYPKLYAYTDA